MTKITPMKNIIDRFSFLYEEKFGVKPEFNFAWTGKLIKDRLVNHSEEGIIRIIDLYFQDESNDGKVYHLPTILSAYSFNKYLPAMKYNSDIDDDAEELNKKIW